MLEILTTVTLAHTEYRDDTYHKEEQLNEPLEHAEKAKPCLLFLLICASPHGRA